MAIDRTVRRLRLRAPGEDEVRRVLPRLEDALRCATLPDGDARVLVVRRLVLGRIDQRASAQALARLIEQRMGALRLEWIAGGTPAADTAGFVSFDSPLDARVKLAARLARGEPCTGWYWPLAVREFDPQQSAVQNLRAMVFAIARWPEARVALPAWVAALVRAGAVGLVAAAIAEKEGRALMQLAGIAMPAPQPLAGEDGRAGPQGAPASAAEAAEGGPQAASPRPAPSAPRSWLLDMLQAAGLLGGKVHETVRRVTRPAYPAASASTLLPEVPSPPASQAQGPASPVSGAGAKPSRSRAPVPRPAPRMPARNLASPPVVPHGVREPQVEWPEGEQALSSSQPAPLEQPDYLLPTAAGGVLFLLPVLHRLGLPAWLLAADAGHGGFGSRILAAALHRLRVPPDDPAWLLAAPPPGLVAGGSGPGPVVSSAQLPWESPLLAPPRATAAPELAAALPHAESADAQAVLWLTAARRWLRRAGHIGLASLVSRPARLSLTPTHADMHFELCDADLRVRRLGLDADPGWLPWFGRVVSFHFRDHPRRGAWPGLR